MIEANGGLDHWERIQSISVTCTVSGTTLTRKGFPGSHDIKAIIDTKAQKVEFEKFGGIRGIFTTERTFAGRVGSEAPLDARDNPRDAFKSHDMTTTWDAHNLMYFAGYAFWNYFNAPFFFRRPGFQAKEVDSYRCDNGETWRALQVTFPDNFATHCKIQQLYFDESYRLRRMDYRVDIIPGIRIQFRHGILATTTRSSTVSRSRPHGS